MAMNRDNAAISNYTGVVTDVTINSVTPDVPGTTDLEWMNTRWTQQWGYFTSVPDLKSAILLKAIWNVGKGYDCDSRTKAILEHITGWGKDSFQDILYNMECIKRIGGDAYCEIIRDEDTGLLLNLKPLDPGSIKIVADPQGRLKEYQQISKGKKVHFKPEEIFHLSNNRLGGQIHGLSDIDSVEATILAENESFVDTKKIMHYGARPLILWKLKTDDAAKIAAFKAKIELCRKYGEDMFIPDDEDIVTHEVIQTNPSQMIISWRNDIRNKFYRTIGLPQIVPGQGGDSTESESKVIYLAFEQIVEKEQREIENQIWNQLYLKINLIPPTSLSENLDTDTAKDGGLMPDMNFSGVGG